MLSFASPLGMRNPRNGTSRDASISAATRQRQADARGLCAIVPHAAGHSLRQESGNEPGTDIMLAATETQALARVLHYLRKLRSSTGPCAGFCRTAATFSSYNGGSA